MAKKSALFGGRTVKVENRSSFDKSRLNLLTTGVGTITPIMKQLVIPSSGRCNVAVHAELPPLAADTFLRTHLKLEAFFCPLRLCSGSFESWYSGEPVWDDVQSDFIRAELPRGFFVSEISDLRSSPAVDDHIDDSDFSYAFGPGTLTDYFDVRFELNNNGDAYLSPYMFEPGPHQADVDYYGMPVNLFPYICYHLIFDHFYRNKSVQKPAFVKPALTQNGLPAKPDNASHLPYLCSGNRYDVLLGSDMPFALGSISGISNLGDIVLSPYLGNVSTDYLVNGFHLNQLRQRNFGDDYFTAARAQAQAGSPVTVSTSGNVFTISALRAGEAWQEFGENQNYASPDYIQTNLARYGVKLSDGIAQKPILLASADYPMFTKSVELNNNYNPQADSAAAATRNPFAAGGILGSSAGKASANAQGFNFDFDVKEPGYIMVMATLVPEANYASGISKDMTIFTESGSLVDLPVSLLEHIGDEPIMSSELSADSNYNRVFGYVQRYLWHKAGQNNSVHGLYRKGKSLQAFAPQRNIQVNEQISSDFLKIPTSALDDVAAVDSGVSQFGVMLDCAINLFVSEPLTESALPALVNPASEHGRSIYLYNGGSKLS